MGKFERNIHSNVLEQIETKKSVRKVPLKRHQGDLARISVIGLGYVGTVSIACLADLGHDVVGVDCSLEKVQLIAQGVPPIVETGLSTLLKSASERGKISATLDVIEAVHSTDVSFISVGTPPAEDGSCNMRAIKSVAADIGRALKTKTSYHLVVLRSSVPPGTTETVVLPLIEAYSEKKCGVDFGICFNPEFLREGSAISDFNAPGLTVIGASDGAAAQALKAILEPIDGNIRTTTLGAAEMLKYVNNVWHATKVCFGNEVGRICDAHGVNGTEVMDMLVADTKLNISPRYLKPGNAYGGSCLPKDVSSMAHIALKKGVEAPMISHLHQSNAAHIDHIVTQALAYHPKKIGIIGLSFKKGTDDLRESPMLRLIEKFSDLAVDLSVYDPLYSCAERLKSCLDFMVYDDKLRGLISEKASSMLVEDVKALGKCDCVIIAHEADYIPRSGQHVVRVV